MNEKPTTAKLLKIAMNKHDITWDALAQRVSRDEQADISTATALVDRFKSGASCPLVVAAAIITLIAGKREVA